MYVSSFCKLIRINIFLFSQQCSSNQRRCSKASIGQPEELVREYRLCWGFRVDKGSGGEGEGDILENYFGYCN